MEYVLVVRIVEKGHLRENGEKSIAGHMWYELYDNKGNFIQSFGFNPKNSLPWSEGVLSQIDHREYPNPKPELSYSIGITKEQFEDMKKFGLNPSLFGFDIATWNSLTNNCIDFVWKALEIAGISPMGFEGFMFPKNNAEILLRLINKLYLPSLRAERSSPVFL